MSGSGNGNGSIWSRLLQAGILGFLLAYLLGAVPGLPSPYERWIDAHNREMEQQYREILSKLKTLCYGVWRDQPSRAYDCAQTRSHDPLRIP